MAKFFYIDQSLRSLGGHHYDNAINLLNAVEAKGYVPVLVTHRKFHIKNIFPAHWEVLSCFRHSSYSRYALCGLGSGLPPAGQQGLDQADGTASQAAAKPLWNLPYHWHRWRRQMHLKHFADSCEQVFARHPLEAGDHVFFPTVSEFDLLALSKFLQQHPAAKAACWHLQFHFGIYEGRPAEYEQQQVRINWVRSYFQEALSNTQGVDLRFYNTSHQLADQYNRVGLVKFEALPYPINLAMQPPAGTGDRPQGPLRVTCGGGLRLEKGHNNLAPGLSEIWDTCFASGQMQLQVQAKRSKWRTLHFPQPAEGQAVTKQAAEQPAVKLIPHPLALEEYIEMIRQSHIGLLMYDSRRYYARRAGVLCEFLCSGVPVIVPAGCWLSEQIAEAGFEHLDRIVRQHRLQTSTHLGAIQRSCTTIDQPAGATFSLKRPAGAGDLVIGLRRPNTAPLTYLRMTIDQFGSDGESITSFSNTVGRRTQDAPVWAMWRIAPQTRTLRLTLQNAYDDSIIPIDRLEPVWLEEGQSLPLASVGLIAADEQHVGRLLLEMRDHYEHYRQSALTFSESWRRDHDPHFTATTLLSASSAVAPSSSRAAAA